MKKIITLFPSAKTGFIAFGTTKSAALPTVDAALAPLQKALTELHAVKAAQDAEEKAQLDAASFAVTLANVAQREAVRAARAIAKLEDFIA